MASVEDADCPEVVRSEESAAVGLRNLVTQWHLVQKGALSLALMTSMSRVSFWNISSNAWKFNRLSGQQGDSVGHYKLVH